MGTSHLATLRATVAPRRYTKVPQLFAERRPRKLAQVEALGAKLRADVCHALIVARPSESKGAFKGSWCRSQSLILRWLLATVA